jgi:hypothetical protein
VLDTGGEAVVDSAGTTDRSRGCAVASGDHQPPAQRSDLTAMHFSMFAINAPRLAPTGSDVDGRSVPSLEVMQRR